MHLLVDWLSNYERSYYADRDFLEHPELANDGDREKARRDYLANPLDAILANVQESAMDVRETARILTEARRDGILDRDKYKAANKKEQTRWIKCLNTIRGDYHRAVGELKHWRDYAKFATEGNLPMPKADFSVAELARSMSVEPDRTEDDECPF